MQRGRGVSAVVPHRWWAEFSSDLPGRELTELRLISTRVAHGRRVCAEVHGMCDGS